jgi:hypothetical protein
MSIHRLLASSFLVACAVVAACTSGSSSPSDVITVTSFDTSCKADTDCVAIVAGSIGCCGCANAAINASSKAAYDADVAVIDQHRGVCTADCVDCPQVAPFCANGTCAIPSPPDGGSDAGATCGGVVCASDQVCVMNQVEGGAVVPPNDAGMCTGTDVLLNGMCDPPPSYRCAPAPTTCSGGLDCTCAQPLCNANYTCQSASAGLVQCFLQAP